MDDGTTKHFIIVSHAAVPVVLFATVFAVTVFRRDMIGSVEGQKVMVVDPYVVLKVLATLPAILLMAFFVALRPFVLVFWRFCGWRDGLGAGAGDQAFAGGGRLVMTVFMRTAHDAKTW